MAPQGVLLDIDGTLVLSNDAHAQAWVQAFAEHGYDIPFDRVRPLIGMGGDQLIPQLVPELNPEEGTGKAISDRRKALVLNEFGPNLTAANGSRALVSKLKDSGLKVVAASSATTEELNLLLKAAHVEDLLQTATTASEVENSKPSPDLIEVALDKVQVEPSQAILLGDTPYDIQSAAKAGVGVIALRCGGFPDEQLSGAIAIYDDPADLVAQFDRSPLASGKAAQATGGSVGSSAALPSAAATLQTGRVLMDQLTKGGQRLFETLDRFPQENRSILLGSAFVVAVLLVLKVLFAVMSSLNDIPLVAPLLELIGLGYTVWFINRYLLKEATRQELSQKLQALKNQVLGASTSS
jgi:HAD superfamily hydrolase (TIGR01509 family)